MATALTKLVTAAVYRIIFYQLVLIMGFIAVLFILKGKQSGLSALAGGMAYWLPTLIFARGVTACAGARAVGRFVMAFFAGEAFKLILSGVLFLLAVKYWQVDMFYALLGLVGAILAFWLASAICLFRSEGAL